jgi:hypothetical protein
MSEWMKSNERKKERKNEQTNERTNEQTSTFTCSDMSVAEDYHYRNHTGMNNYTWNTKASNQDANKRRYNRYTLAGINH